MASLAPACQEPWQTAQQLASCNTFTVDSFVSHRIFSGDITLQSRC